MIQWDQIISDAEGNRRQENNSTVSSKVANVTIVAGVAQSSVGTKPLKNTPAPSVLYKYDMVEATVTYGLIGIVEAAGLEDGALYDKRGCLGVGCNISIWGISRRI